MLDTYEMNKADEMKAKGWGNQTIANILGRSLIDIQQYFDPTLRSASTVDATSSNCEPKSTPHRTAGARDQIFKTMWLAGVSIAEITSATGIPRNSIFKLRQRLGLASRHNRRPAAEIVA